VLDPKIFAMIKKNNRASMSCYERHSSGLAFTGGDTIKCNACITDKYSKNGEYFVDLIFWCQTLDRYPVEEGHATVKLPKKALALE
jgi:hypothetical protein